MPDLRRGREFAGNEFFGTFCEASDLLAEHDAERLQKPTDLVLDLPPNAHQDITSRQKGPDNVGAMALDTNLLVPPGADDLRQPSRVVTIGLVRHHREGGVGMTRVQAYNRQLAG